MTEVLGSQWLIAIPLGFALAMLAFALINFATRAGSPGLPVPDPARPQGMLLFQSGAMVDANPAGLAWLKNESPQGIDWASAASILQERFPNFPTEQGTRDCRSTECFAALNPQDPTFAILDQWDDLARIRIQTRTYANQNTAPGFAEVAMTNTPYPIWQTDVSGKLLWANTAYLALAKTVLPAEKMSPLPRLFETPVQSDAPRRTAVRNPNEDVVLWFDVTNVKAEGSLIHYASDANTIVNAEIAQRKFVQTLTKTFAQLSIGLAIFDRNRQLSLFNPALIDLTSLPADFLSSRPNMQAFFDRLRENRMMPEPKNYSSWRERIAELVVAAADDRYSETWSLPSGLTYKVNGRPHPDGAIALLFEDISAEISLTRRFRADIELGQSIIDALPDAIAVMSPNGTISNSNRAYRTLWSTDPDTTLANYTIGDALSQWRRASAETDFWTKVQDHIETLDLDKPFFGRFEMKSGQSFSFQLSPLSAGFKVISFSPLDSGETDVTRSKTRTV
jgi:PAS domain-containing protein